MIGSWLQTERQRAANLRAQRIMSEALRHSVKIDRAEGEYERSVKLTTCPSEGNEAYKTGFHSAIYRCASIARVADFHIADLSRALDQADREIAALKARLQSHPDDETPIPFVMEDE